ncbi:hypothetical protein NDU88_008813 [Pleurodeles waltl]|uniref:Uncharacterized protein n=1 Tax=Pleurodeles waltl TaxID=8319 RepID=A0AAV7NX75_PLEWA|nr:hypothetical protein NDU88_008813 [Pleurodeles waltl]
MKERYTPCPPDECVSSRLPGRGLIVGPPVLFVARTLVAYPVEHCIPGDIAVAPYQISRGFDLNEEAVELEKKRVFGARGCTCRANAKQGVPYLQFCKGILTNRSDQDSTIVTYRVLWINIATPHFLVAPLRNGGRTGQL